MTPRAFEDRRDAGRQLAESLDAYRSREDVVVLALPRGGVPVAYEIAKRLSVPLDVVGVRKLGVPGHEELAAGAIATGGIRYVDRALAGRLGIGPELIDQIARREERELARRDERYRHGLPPLQLKGQTIILVDDGLATGSTMRAAVEAIRTRSPASIVVAVPVASPEICELFSRLADRCFCLYTPYPMMSVGSWYQDFSQITDEEVSVLLDASREARHTGAGTR